MNKSGKTQGSAGQVSYGNGVQKEGIPSEKEKPRQNIPIKSEIKMKRIFQREPIDESCWAWMKLLRETNKTKKIYDVNPYAEVYRFRDNVYGILTESADGMGDPWMYLITGPEKALLIDTSFGIGDLRGLVDEITGGMPTIVVNTHASVDHSYGNFQFEKVYCHEYAVPYLQKQMDPHIWDHFFNEEGNGIWADFDRNDIVPLKEYEIVGCPNGTVFDLGGGYEIELIFLPGHQSGHCGYLDKRNRILFAGDSIISMRVGISGPKPGMPYGEYATVTAFRNELERLVKRLDEFDYVFSGHFIGDLENVVVSNMLKACNEVVENPERCAFKRETGHGITYYKYVEGLGTLAYNLNSV